MICLKDPKNSRKNAFNKAKNIANSMDFQAAGILRK